MLTLSRWATGSSPQGGYACIPLRAKDQVLHHPWCLVQLLGVVLSEDVVPLTQTQTQTCAVSDSMLDVEGSDNDVESIAVVSDS